MKEILITAILFFIIYMQNKEIQKIIKTTNENFKDTDNKIKMIGEILKNHEEYLKNK